MTLAVIFLLQTSSCFLLAESQSECSTLCLSFVCEHDNLLDCREPESDKPKEAEKCKQSQLYDALITFLGTVRLFYSQIAKAVHTQNARRRTLEDPTPGLKLACALVAMNQRDNLIYNDSMVWLPQCQHPDCSHTTHAHDIACLNHVDEPSVSSFCTPSRETWPNVFWVLQWPGVMESFVGVPLQQQPPHISSQSIIRDIPVCSGGIGPVPKAVDFVTFMASTTQAVLFDTRRLTSHSLILNYFVACGGLDLFLTHCRHVLRMLEIVGPKAPLGVCRGTSHTHFYPPSLCFTHDSISSAGSIWNVTPDLGAES